MVILLKRSMALKGRSKQLNRRVMYVIAAVVAAAVVVAGAAYYLDTYKYPSEDTPLVLQPWGITWINEQDDSDGLDQLQLFGDLRLWWSSDPSSTSSSTPPLNCTTSLSSTAEFELSLNVTTLSETYSVGWISDCLSDPTLGINVVAPHGVFIVDANENGLFDKGDSISIFRGVYENDTLMDEGFRNDVEYGIALEPGLEFMFAIHHGKLYAWQDDWRP